MVISYTRVSAVELVLIDKRLKFLFKTKKKNVQHGDEPSPPRKHTHIEFKNQKSVKMCETTQSTNFISLAT